jgi:hypothetical protein
MVSDPDHGARPDRAAASVPVAMGASAPISAHVASASGNPAPSRLDGRYDTAGDSPPGQSSQVGLIAATVSQANPTPRPVDHRLASSDELATFTRQVLEALCQHTKAPFLVIFVHDSQSGWLSLLSAYRDGINSARHLDEPLENRRLSTAIEFWKALVEGPGCDP